GLADGSSDLTSALVAGPLADGILRSGVRFLPLHAMYFGASNPDWSLLYELTSGLQTAVNPLACSRMPAMKCLISPLSPNSSFSSKKTLVFSLNNETLKCMPLPAMPYSGFGMNVACILCFLAIVLATSL